MKRLRLAAIPVLAVAMQAAFAEAPKGHGDEAMKEYQAGGSPMADVKRNTLVYLVYSDKLIEGSPQNNVTAVPVPRSTPLQLR